MAATKLSKVARDLARKNARAETMMHAFATKLVKLGDGKVPERWKRMTQQALAVTLIRRLY